jgi:hypothetical protein
MDAGCRPSSVTSKVASVIGSLKQSAGGRRDIDDDIRTSTSRARRCMGLLSAECSEL